MKADMRSSSIKCLHFWNHLLLFDYPFMDNRQSPFMDRETETLIFVEFF